MGKIGLTAAIALACLAVMARAEDINATLDRLLPEIEAHGDLVLAVPNRGLLLVTEDTAQIIAALHALVSNDLKTEPYLITDRLYLWHKGVITPLPPGKGI